MHVAYSWFCTFWCCFKLYLPNQIRAEEAFLFPYCSWQSHVGSADILNSHERSLNHPLHPGKEPVAQSMNSVSFQGWTRTVRVFSCILRTCVYVCVYQHCILYTASLQPIYTPGFMVYFGSSVIAGTVFTAIFSVFCIALPINQHCNKAEREITGKAAELLNSSKPFKTSMETNANAIRSK